MSSSLLSTGLTGSLFGSALYLSGVYSPTTITSQLHLTSFHMLKVFLTATASSALLFQLAKRTQLSPCTPRKPSNLNRLHSYDGNLIGGLILGSGLALTGACPGTVLVQLSTGISSAIPVFIGAVFGGTIWSLWGHCATCTPPSATEGDCGCDEVQKKKEEFTVYASGKISETKALLAFEGLCLALIATASFLLPGEEKRLNPIVGGLLIGAAQGASLLLTHNSIGVSTAYERVGQYMCQLPTLSFSKLQSSAPIVFALGIMGGSWGMNRLAGNTMAVLETKEIGMARALVGGVALVTGARMAGGCTSGHGISGMATLSKSSFVTVAAMFAGGIGLSLFLE